MIPSVPWIDVLKKNVLLPDGNEDVIVHAFSMKKPLPQPAFLF